MEERKSDVSLGVKVSADAKPSFRASRRHIIAGVASFGALIAAGALAPAKAVTHDKRNGIGGAKGKGKGVIGGGKGKGGGGGGGSGGGGSGGGGKGHCFLKGTLILTPEGERTIESLVAGDQVVTASGDTKPVKWVGRMTFERDPGARWDDETAPIKIEAGALNGILPAADLYVSPAHGLLVEGLLIPASQFVNGRTITRCSDNLGSTLEYFHLELDCHDVVLANGTAAESLRATSESRQAFDNWAEYDAQFGVNSVVMLPFAPLVCHGTRLEAAKSRLRSIIAPVFDCRTELDKVRDAVDAQAFAKKAA